MFFFRLRNGSGKIIVLGERWFVPSFDQHTTHWRGEGLVKSEFLLVINLNFNTVNRRLMIDLFGPRHVSTADDKRMSKIEQAFEVVRGGRLH